MIKCNFDASLFGDADIFGVTTVIRNHQGHFQSAKTTWFIGNPLPQEAEAIAFQTTINWISKQNLHHALLRLQPFCRLHEFSNLQQLWIWSHPWSLLREGFQHFNKLSSQAVNYLTRKFRFYASQHVFDLIPTSINSLIMNEILWAWFNNKIKQINLQNVLFHKNTKLYCYKILSRASHSMFCLSIFLFYIILELDLVVNNYYHWKVIYIPLWLWGGF